MIADVACKAVCIIIHLEVAADHGLLDDLVDRFLLEGALKYQHKGLLAGFASFHIVLS